MKIHYNASIFPSTNIVIECGVGGNGIPATTDHELVTCKNCLRRMDSPGFRPPNILGSRPDFPVMCLEDGKLTRWGGKI